MIRDDELLLESKETPSCSRSSSSRTKSTTPEAWLVHVVPIRTEASSDSHSTEIESEDDGRRRRDERRRQSPAWSFANDGFERSEERETLPVGEIGGFSCSPLKSRRKKERQEGWEDSASSARVRTKERESRRDKRRKLGLTRFVRNPC